MSLSDKLGAIGSKLRIRKPKDISVRAYSPLYHALDAMDADDALMVAEKLMRANYAIMNDEGFGRWLTQGNNRSLLAFRMKGAR